MAAVSHMVLAGSSPPLNLVKQAHNIGATVNVDIPACQNGDVGVFIAFCNNGNSGSPAAAISTPTGWTPVGSAVHGTGDRHHIQVFAKILTTAESGTTLTGASGASSQNNSVITLRGDYPIISMAPGDFEGVVTADDPAGVTISCSAATRKGVAAFGFHASRSGDIRTIVFNPTYDTLITSDTRVSVVWKVFADRAAVDIAADTNDAGAGNTFATWFIEAE